MIFSLGSRLGLVDVLLGLRLGVWLGLWLDRGSPGRRIGGVDELRNACLDRLVGGELGLGVELEVALRPVQRVDHGVVAGLAVALGMKKMSEQEVQRGRLPVPIADGKGTRGPLTLSGLQ